MKMRAPLRSRRSPPATRRANAELLRSLPFGDRVDFDEAQRGFIAALPGAIMSADGQRTIWSMQPYAFETGEAPATVNPSLWRPGPTRQLPRPLQGHRPPLPDPRL
jgi:alkyl sulfatase BDS1-like metallo-beta-lactamase superfamily hydrolase